jgi:hypothetical protein
MTMAVLLFLASTNLKILLKWVNTKHVHEKSPFPTTLSLGFNFQWIFTEKTHLNQNLVHSFNPKGIFLQNFVVKITGFFISSPSPIVNLPHSTCLCHWLGTSMANILCETHY